MSSLGEVGGLGFLDELGSVVVREVEVLVKVGLEKVWEGFG